MGLGKSLMRLRLAPAKNYDEIVALVKEAVGKARPASGSSDAAGTRRNGIVRLSRVSRSPHASRIECGLAE